uniref:Uncharacterized protein n=1 Tax=Meloidogyne incognita TaxID=6306 RepID=A0A914N7Y7_MELIC
MVSVSSSRLDLKNTIFNSRNRHIKSSTAQVKNQDVALALAFLIQTISDGRSSWLVDDTQNIKSRNRSSILCGLALTVVEVSRHSDDSIFDRLTQKCLSRFLHFTICQDHCRNFLKNEKLKLKQVNLKKPQGRTPSTWIFGRAPSPWITLNGQCFMSD